LLALQNRFNIRAIQLASTAEFVLREIQVAITAEPVLVKNFLEAGTVEPLPAQQNWFKPGSR
jgi:hypothetical protein